MRATTYSGVVCGVPVTIIPLSVWAARGCLESSLHLPGSGQDDSLGGLPSKECRIKPIPIPQFPDTRILAFLECLTTAGMLCSSLENRLLPCFILAFHFHKSPAF